jgi:hypothetical protein
VTCSRGLPGESLPGDANHLAVLAPCPDTAITRWSKAAALDRLHRGAASFASATLRAAAIVSNLLMDAHGWRRARSRQAPPKSRMSAMYSSPQAGFSPQTRNRISSRESPAFQQSEKYIPIGAHRKHPRLERAYPVARTAVTANLVVGITDEANIELLGQELRSAPIQMEISAALILGDRILEIVGESGNSRKLMSCRWVEIGIPAAGIDGAMPKPEVGQACRAVITDGDVSGDVGHEIVDPHVPLQRRQRIEVTESRHGVADTVGSHQAEGRQRGRQGSVHVGTRASDDRSHLHSQLAAEDRRRKHIARNNDREIRAGVQICIEVDVEGGIKSPNLDFARCRDIGAGTDGRMIVN